LQPLQPRKQSNLPSGLRKVNNFSVAGVSLALQHRARAPEIGLTT